MKQEQIVSYFFLALFLFIIYQIFLIFSPFLKAIFWAAVLAFAFHPLYQQIRKRIHLSPTMAALATTLFVVLVVILPATLILLSVMKEVIVDLYERIGAYISSGNLNAAIDKARQTLTAYSKHDFGFRWDVIQQDLASIMLNWTQRFAKVATNQFAAATKNILIWFLNFFVTIILLFFFLKNGSAYHEFLDRIIPMSRKNKDHLTKQLNDAFSAVIRGQFLISILQGTLAGFVFWFLGFPFPYLFGCLTFLTSLTPTGAATVWLPVAISLFITGETGRSLWLAGAGCFISLLDNVLKPFLIGEKINLPILLLFLGFFGGLQLYGFTGIFLGPIVLSLFFALLKIYREEYFDGT